MTFKNLRYGLSSSVVLAASLFSVPSYAATDSIGLTVITTVEIGTCTATLVLKMSVSFSFPFRTRPIYSMLLVQQEILVPCIQ